MTQFALSGCTARVTTTSQNRATGSGTMTLNVHGASSIAWAAPFQGGVTLTGPFALKVAPNPDENELPNGSCPSGETEDAISGRLRHSYTDPSHQHSARGHWSFEICGPPTALEPHTAFALAWSR